MPDRAPHGEAEDVLPLLPVFDGDPTEFGTVDFRPANVVYAKEYTITQDPLWIRFRGGPTPGHVCSEELQSYKVPTENLIAIGPPTQCRARGGVYYQTVQFR
jgi:hypothetical protein